MFLYCLALLLTVIFSDIPPVEFVIAKKVITRPGSSEADCAKACIEEQEIQCRFYRHDYDVCTLSADHDISLANLQEVGKPAQSELEIVPVTTKVSPSLEQLEARIIALEEKNINFHDMDVMNAIIAGFKVTRGHLLTAQKFKRDQNPADEDRAKLLANATKILENDIQTLEEIREAFKVLYRNKDMGSKVGIEMSMVSINDDVIVSYEPMNERLYYMALFVSLFAIALKFFQSRN